MNSLMPRLYNWNIVNTALFLASVIFLSLTQSTLFAQTPQEYTITGRVLDSLQKPLAGVRIIALKGGDTTAPLQAGVMDRSAFVGGAIVANNGAFTLLVKGNPGAYTILATSVMLVFAE
jgi:hypothetical protein